MITNYIVTNYIEMDNGFYLHPQENKIYELIDQRYVLIADLQTDTLVREPSRLELIAKGA